LNWLKGALTSFVSAPSERGLKLHRSRAARCAGDAWRATAALLKRELGCDLALLKSIEQGRREQDSRASSKEKCQMAMLAIWHL
jgi:hypothetical protein